MLDVLEHLDDDQAALRRIAPLIAPGGTLIVSVPALPELFSEYDQIQGHRRRYTRERFRAAFEGTGFTVKALHWWGAWMVPVLKLMRRPNRPQQAPKSYSHYLRIPSPPVRWVMEGLYAVEAQRPVLRRLPIGTSLIAVAKRS